MCDAMGEKSLTTAFFGVLFYIGTVVAVSCSPLPCVEVCDSRPKFEIGGRVLRQSLPPNFVAA